MSRKPTADKRPIARATALGSYQVSTVLRYFDIGSRKHNGWAASYSRSTGEEDLGSSHQMFEGGISATPVPATFSAGPGVDADCRSFSLLRLALPYEVIVPKMVGYSPPQGCAAEGVLLARNVAHPTGISFEELLDTDTSPFALPGSWYRNILWLLVRLLQQPMGLFVRERVIVAVEGKIAVVVLAVVVVVVGCRCCCCRCCCHCCDGCSFVDMADFCGCC